MGLLYKTSRILLLFHSHPRPYRARTRVDATKQATCRKSKTMNPFSETTVTSRAVAPEGMNEEFKKCLKQERDRARSWRESAQGKFETSMLSLDRLVDTFEDPSKAAAFSDGGAEAEWAVRACDGEGSPAYYRACVKRALNRLRNRPELQKTLRLVVKNGNRREDSMWEILASGRCPTWEAAKTLYWTHLKKMLNIFCGQ